MLPPDDLRALVAAARVRLGYDPDPDVLAREFCRECDAEREYSPEWVDGFCSAPCRDMQAEDAPTRWSPQATAIAAAAVERTTADPTRCRECGERLPERTGRRGRPRVVCDPAISPGCKERRDRRRDAAQHTHRAVAQSTDPNFIGAGAAASGSLLRGSDLDSFALDGADDERQMFGPAYPSHKLRKQAIERYMRQRHAKGL